MKKPTNVKNTVDAKDKIPDLKIVGNPDMFQLLCKASSVELDMIKSCKAIEVVGGCVVSVSSIHGGNVAEALTYVPDVKIVEDVNGGRKLVAISEV